MRRETGKKVDNDDAVSFVLYLVMRATCMNNEIRATIKTPSIRSPFYFLKSLRGLARVCKGIEEFANSKRITRLRVFLQ